MVVATNDRTTGAFDHNEWARSLRRHLRRAEGFERLRPRMELPTPTPFCDAMAEVTLLRFDCGRGPARAIAKHFGPGARTRRKLVRALRFCERLAAQHRWAGAAPIVEEHIGPPGVYGLIARELRGFSDTFGALANAMDSPPFDFGGIATVFGAMADELDDRIRRTAGS